MEGLESYLRDIDDGLVFYNEEFVKLAVKRDATLKYLRPYEVEGMNIPPVYIRMLVERIVNLQTPDMKSTLKLQCIEDFCAQPKTSKPWRFGSPVHVPTTPANITPERQPRSKAETAFENFPEQEVARLNEERDTLSVLKVHKKDELNKLKHKLNALSAISIPGNQIMKSSCDNRHRSVMNGGNKSCPFTACKGYHVCG